MTCPRCASLLITQYDETRCYACGFYDNPPYPESIRDPYDRIKCRNCANKNVPGKTYCQHCLDVMYDYRKAKQAKRETA